MSVDKDENIGRRGPLPIAEWARGQRELLTLERDEEILQISDSIAQLTAQECMELGISLVPLAVTGVSTGLYGRACVSVGDPRGRPIPSQRLGAGDQVRLYSPKGANKRGDLEGEGVSEITGVVGKVTETIVEVISEDADEAGSLQAPLRLDVVASEATHKKLMLGLEALEKHPGGGPAERVINVLFGVEPPSLVRSTAGALTSTPPPPAGPPSGAPAEPTVQVPTALKSLNDSQREAVVFALSTRDVALIHGPPGTGKTTAVVALIREAVRLGWRCLVCAPSNVAVDGILERLVAAEPGSGTGGHGGVSRKSGDGNQPRVVRMGHPARLLPQVLEHSMEALVSRHEGTAIVKDVRKEIDQLVTKLYGAPGRGGDGGGGGGGGGGGRKSRSSPRVRGADRKEYRREVKTLRKEARAREGKVVREVLRSRNVVLATCVGAATYYLREEEFDLVIIDEAAQALEAACWIPVLKGRRLVLAGDHKQLAPTVKSRKAEAGLPPLPPLSDTGPGSSSADSSGSGGADGLGLTMFDRVLRDIGHDVCRMLDVQYRMNQDISRWASHEMYGGLLRPHPSVAERELSDLPHVKAAGEAGETDMWAAVMLLIDTTGCDMPEEEAGGGSRRNEREAEVAVRHVKGLLEAGLRESEVAIISPYNGQVNALKQLLRPEHPGVEVRSVDGFQGGEKEAIVLSLVRSNPGRKVGFLADARRLNVAVTRAKRHVAVVCDAECCGSDAFVGRLLRHIEDRGEYRSALELQQDDFVGEAAGAQAAALSVEEAMVARNVGVAADESGSAASRTGEGRGGPPGSFLSDEDVLRRVTDFAQRESSEKEMVLPSELTARQRALVHETAERLGLGHASTGEGHRRALVLSVGGGGAAAARGGTSALVDDDEIGIDNSDTRGKGGDSLFAVLSEGESGGNTDEDDDDEDSGQDDFIEGEAEVSATSVATAAASDGETLGEQGAPKDAAGGPLEVTSVSCSPPVGPGGPGTGAGAKSANTLLARLHAERVARGSPAPPPPPPQGRKKKGGRGAKGAPGGVVSRGDADARGFTVDTPSRGGGGGGGGVKKSASTKIGSGSKKAKKKSGRGTTLGGSAQTRTGERVYGGGGVGGVKSGKKGSHKGDVGLKDDDGDGYDDDLAFLDAQIKKERASEPCYASLLRSTTEAMRRNNPGWAAAQDRGKPAKSGITRARRTQLEGAFQTRLAEEEKKRVRSSGDKGDKKS